MPSTSPYQQNDYQAASTYRPYKLPINDIFKANAAINAYWDQGAARVKNVYDTALGLKLKTTDNKQIRDQFIKDADKQLTKVSSMNLADASVQRQGMDIYKPLLKDENIVGEDYVVGHAESELAIGESYRQKDGGKNYNPLSIENIQFEQNLLSLDPTQGGLNKRDGWKSIAQSQSKYSPYTDVTKEYKQIQDMVKKDEMKNAELSGDASYILKTEKSGVSKARMEAAIQEMGSPQLKAQIAVEGRNVFYKKLQADPIGVDAYYQGLATSYYNTKIGEIKTEKAKLEYENSMLSIDSTDPEMRKNSIAKLNSNKKLIDGLNETISSAENKYKPEYVNSFKGLSNSANLSSNINKIEQLWQQSSIDNLAAKLAYESSSFDIKANPVAISQRQLELGYKKLQLDYYQLEEQKRNNLEQNRIGWWNATHKKDGSGGIDGDNSNTNENPIAVSANGAGVLPLPQSTVDPKTIEADVKDLTSYYANKDKPLMDMTTKSILGEEGQMRLERGVDSDAPLATNLLDFEVDSAASFVKAFADKYLSVNSSMRASNPIFAQIDLPEGASLADYKAAVSKMSTSTFKKLSTEMVKTNSDFVADYVGTHVDAGGQRQKTALEFRSEYNKTLRDQINASETITKASSAALGEYKQFFPNDGKVILTDEVIHDAFKKAINQGVLPVKYFRRGYTAQTKSYSPLGQSGPISSDTGVPISKDEYDKLPESQKYKQGTDIQTFTTEVRRRTNPAIYALVTEGNKNMHLWAYDSKNKEKKAYDLNMLTNLIPKGVDTDKEADNKEMIDFMTSHPDQLLSRIIKNPGVGEALPKVSFKFDPGSANMTDWDMDLITKINNTEFEITGLGSNFTQKPTQQYTRHDGAILAHVPFGGTDVSGYVQIMNTSASPNTVTPKLITIGDFGILELSDDKRSTNLIKYGPPQIEKKFYSDNQMSMTEALQKDKGPDVVNAWLTEFITGLEQYNRSVKSKIKK